MIPDQTVAAANAMAPVVKKLEATLLAQAALEAAAQFLRAQALEELLTPEALERARKVVEDELIDWRDEGRFVLRRNGLAIRNKDGSGSEIIRFGFEDGLRIAVRDNLRAASERDGKGQ